MTEDWHSKHLVPGLSTIRIGRRGGIDNLAVTTSVQMSILISLDMRVYE